MSGFTSWFLSMSSYIGNLEGLDLSSTIELINNKLNLWTGGYSPYLVKIIRIFGGTASLFIATQMIRRIWYSAYHKYKKYPPGPIGIPFFGCLFTSMSPDWQRNMAKTYGPICCYPIGPLRYGILINDMELMIKYF